MASPSESSNQVNPEPVAENGNIPDGEHHDGGGNQPRQGGWRGRGGRGRGSRFDRRPPPRDGDFKPENDFGGGDGVDRRGGDGGDRRGDFGERRGRGGFRGRGGRGGGGPRGDRGDLGGMGMSRTPDDRLLERVSQLGGPTYELVPLDTSEKKFSGRGRIYVGNIAPDTSEDEIAELFKSFGETNELFYNKEKNFGFIRLDYHASAERAKRELDGTNFKGRTLKIRFAPNGSTVKVKNLTPFVSNELLYFAFSVFGDIERCIVVVDDRGKSTGEGIVEFARKGSATLAIRKCDENCYFLTTSLRPVIVEQYDIVDDSDGFSDKSILKRNMDFQVSREIGPRFANINSFEHEYGMRWKQLHELYAQKEKGLRQELEMEKEKLEAQMEYARYEHETEMLREQLRAREMDRDRRKRDWEMKEQRMEDVRQRNMDQMRHHQDDMQSRLFHQEDDTKRRQQENSLFMQAHQLDSLLDQEEKTFDKPVGFEGNAPAEGDAAPDAPTPLVDPKTFMNQFDRNPRFEGRAGGNMGGRWVNEGRGGNRDDFPNKRRRF